MEKKINASLVVARRAARLWSQDDLARACKLDLATVQHAENEGLIPESALQPLTTVLGLDSNELLAGAEDGRYQHRQIGWAVMFVMFATCATIVTLFALSPLPGLTAVLIIIPLIALMVIFSSLYIELRGGLLRWHYGPGFFSKQEAIALIESCSQVKNKAFWGVGIRYVPPGMWLYNVSGLDAVEINLKNGKKLRLGTDEPEVLCQAITAALQGEQSSP